MEKQFKPVPDIDLLKYHGTPEKPDIKIFVSHRIDLESETIDNPLYIPVRCGAVYDDRDNVTVLGDDTGDNISNLRPFLSEYTVMYWAWKNIKADYYGLCHYRRFLSFLSKDFPGPTLKQGFFDSLSTVIQKECGLSDESNMRNEIVKYDINVSYEYSLKDIQQNNKYRTTKESWIKEHAAFLKEKDFDLLEKLIKEMAPEYYESAVEYFKGKKFIGFNIFVMKKKYFEQLCEFMFPILLKFNSLIEKDHYSDYQMRAASYAGEWLYSIFIYQKSKDSSISIKYRQILCFQDTSKNNDIYPIEVYGKKGHIPVVMVATDMNRPLLGVLIESLLFNSNPNYHYDILILFRGYDEDKWTTFLKKEEDKTLKEIVEKFPNANIRFYCPKEKIGSIEYREFDKNNNEELFYQLLLPWILPLYDRVIFFADHIIVDADISPLFETNIGNKYIAATKNIYFEALLNGFVPDFKKKSAKLQLKDPYNYVSSSVVLMDLDKIRNNIEKRVVFDEIKNMDSMRMSPVDLFNRIYDTNVYFLSSLWNKYECDSPQFFFYNDYFPAEDNNDRISSETKIFNLGEFTGVQPPEQSEVKKAFWKYARLTPFYEELIFVYSNPMIQTIINKMIATQSITGLIGYQSPNRKLINKMFPIGSKRRKCLKTVFPDNSLFYIMIKKLYHTISPER